MRLVYRAKGKEPIKVYPKSDDLSCNCVSWLAHWRRYTKRIPIGCHVDGCTNYAAVGAHITRPHAPNQSYKRVTYILPMCQHHASMKSERLVTKTNVELVWANVRQTCRKKIKNNTTKEFEDEHST